MLTKQRVLISSPDLTYKSIIENNLLKKRNYVLKNGKDWILAFQIKVLKHVLQDKKTSRTETPGRATFMSYLCVLDTLFDWLPLGCMKPRPKC